ncbi:DUF1394-domain-containing protein [Hesseltinella vesiculosa]|uniref:DUF1394-domain-containing protein n=1 Tax=Hesseltinella vesiculosa TaxID=101127 RepID=A0A1X2GMV4_9FUNG|nr:DUF1394-domain-containing protein [Hesseltinella vesiculosa]
MGQLFSSFRHEAPIPDMGFDIENPTPSSQDQSLYEDLHHTLVEPCPALLGQLKSYAPSDAFKTAIEQATPENEEKAWNAALPTVNMLRLFYSYSRQLQDGLPRLLSVLCKDTHHFDAHPGLTKLMTQVIEFAYDFDYWKMRTPGIANDFAYYRRLLVGGRFRPSPMTVEDNHDVSDLRSAMQEDDQAHKITMFLAPATPMLTVILDTLSNYISKHKVQKQVVDCLVALWAACTHSLKKRNLDDVTTATALKSMVLSIVLYDHIAPAGAYHKQSGVQVKPSIKLIQTSPHPTEETKCDSLLSILRNSSKHLKDDATPKSIKVLLGVS